MSDVWQVTNHSGENLVTRRRNDKLILAPPKRAFSVNSMAAYQVKVKCGEERFSTVLIKDITFTKHMQEIKRNYSPLVHVPTSNIHVHYHDEDSDMIDLWEDSGGFCFGEMLRSAKEVKEQDYKKIFLQASEIDSPLPSKMRQTDLRMPSSEADNELLQPKHTFFTPEGERPAATTGNCAEKRHLDFQ